MSIPDQEGTESQDRADGRANRELTIRLLRRQENCRNFHQVFALVRNEDDAPAAHAFAISPLPLNTLQWFHITTKRVVSHFAQTLEDEVALVPRDVVKLFCGAFG
jgi:hypothetical protein